MNRCPHLQIQPSVCSQQNFTLNQKIGFQSHQSSEEDSATGQHALLYIPLVTCQLINFKRKFVPGLSLAGFSSQYLLVKG